MKEMIIAAVIPDLKAKGFEEAIKELIEYTGVDNKEEAYQAVMARESEMSTAVGDGVAIPHAKLEGLGHVVAVVGRSKEGILNGNELTNIFVLTLSDKSKAGPHVIFLSEIMSLLSSPSRRAELLNARDEEEMWKVITTL